ncbi:MAG: isoprenylcysteine carboxylmethyltransferase family protein [Hyphomicrobiaceae bacterium]|nr:isoprenylcysteine carboxylmethyltransferase family protein [Hyphomicrobiaceae bacterium]
MAERDTAGVIMPPPIAWLLAVVAGVELDRIFPQAFHGLALAPRLVIGGAVLAAGVALNVWSVRTMLRHGTRFETSRPSTAIVAQGPYRFSRNPIYTGMLLGLVGLAVLLDTAWLLAVLVPFYLVIRYGVVAREEAYLERKFGADYLAYKGAVRRWI